MREDMNQEIVNAHLQHYYSLLRVKKAETESSVNPQLDIEIKTVEATLKTLGVELSEFEFLK